MTLPTRKNYGRPANGKPALAFVASVILVLSAASYPASMAFAAPGDPTLAVTTADSSGGQISGYYVVLSQGGTVTGTAFSPADFALGNGTEYLLSVSDYGDYSFDHWQDTGSAVRERSVSISEDTQLAAVYRNANDVDDEQPPEQPGDEPAAEGQSTVTVRTTDSGSEDISGYYAILLQDGAVVGAGFSPVDFVLDNGQTYAVSVSDYGSYYFNYWQDTESADRERTFAVSEDLVLTAVYSVDPSGLPPTDTEEPEPGSEDDAPEDPNPTGGQSLLVVRTAESTVDNEIAGYYTVLSQGGAVIEAAFSPATFTLDNGLDYAVSVSDYGDFTFDHWNGTGSTIRERSISVTEDTEIAAVYQNIDGGSGDEQPAEETEPADDDTTEEPPAPSGQSTITVSTRDSAGSAISGYYTTLLQGSAVIDSGFSPADFTVDNGQTYQVAVSDYGDFTFDRWNDTGSDIRERTISVSSDTHLTAVYAGTAPAEDEEDTTPDDAEDDTTLPPGESGTITVYAHRIPSPFWGPTFTGASAAMWFVLYNSTGWIVTAGFYDENGTIVSELDDSETYYVYATRCDECHGSTHDVILHHWEDGSTENPRGVATGTSVTAFYEYVP